MTLIEHSEDRCTCKPSREDPSVIGACACPEHGMKALTRERDALADQLRGAVEALSACVYVLENCSNATADPEMWERLAAQALEQARAALPRKDGTDA